MFDKPRNPMAARQVYGTYEMDSDTPGISLLGGMVRSGFGIMDIGNVVEIQLVPKVDILISPLVVAGLTDRLRVCGR